MGKILFMVLEDQDMIILEDHGIEVVRLAKTEDAEKFLIRHRVAIKMEGPTNPHPKGFERELKKEIYASLKKSVEEMRKRWEDE